MSVAFKSAIDDAVLDELRAITGDPNRVLPNLSSRVNRTRVPAPFPVHRWADHMPDVAVLPTSAEEVSEIGACVAYGKRPWIVRLLTPAPRGWRR